MRLVDLDKIAAGLSGNWAGFLRDWDRSLRSANHPGTTRYNYLLAAAQLGRYLAEHSPDPDADGAAQDPTEVRRAHVESFQAWMVSTRSASTALNKHKALQNAMLLDFDPTHGHRRPSAANFDIGRNVPLRSPRPSGGKEGLDRQPGPSDTGQTLLRQGALR